MKGKFIIYQILLRVFANTNDRCVSGGSLQLNGSGKFSDITDELLASLRTLSVTHIWYTGVIEHATASAFPEIGLEGDNRLVVKGEAGSPYAIKDYYDVNPYLADNPAERMQEFLSMVERTHNAGLKVILDFVPNHLSRVYRSDVNPEADFGREDDCSKAFLPDNNFYYLPGESFNASNITDDAGLGGSYTEYPAKVTGNDCFTASPGKDDWYETVKLNYGVDYMHGREKHFTPRPKTWKMMLDVLLYWIDKGADGFRCDMAEMVPVEFWKYAIGEVKKVRKDAIFIAETYDPHLYKMYLDDGGFDYLYDKVGLYDTLKAISRGERGAGEITNCWQNVDKFQERMLNFLENHDEQRIASDFNLSDPFKAIPELAVSLLLNRAPFMLYFGQEVGERGMECEGYSGIDGRTSIFDYCSAPSVTDYFKYLSGVCGFDKLDARRRELYTVYSRLMNIALSEDAIKYGYTFDLEYANVNNGANPEFNPHCHYVFARRSMKVSGIGSESLILVATDFSQSSGRMKIFLPKYLFECWNIKEQRVTLKSLLDGESHDAVLNYDSCVEIRLDRYGIAVVKADIG